MSSSVVIIGAGLAGCECAVALANRGIPVILYEMKPESYSPAHTSPDFAELVCSNSFRSNEPESAVGLLKEEMRALGSLSMAVAEETKVPAGKALAVDRERFARTMTERVMNTPGVTVIRKEITNIDDPASLTPDGSAPRAVVVAAGPLASDVLSHNLAAIAGVDSLYFYDAIAPIILTESVNMDIAFWGGRYNPDDTDYLNCPMEKDEYFAFYEALIAGEKVQAREFEKEKHFEGCMPIEALAERGPKTLTFGPFKPVGFTDPRTGRRPWALLQLRLENLNKSTVNMVGCQTKLTYGAQAEIFRMIPGLENAEFARFGSMHRNTFVNAPKALAPDLSLVNRPGVYLAGQITGVEGYVESAANGLWLGISLAATLNGSSLPPLPETTAMGALLRHLQTPVKHFQPSNVQYGLMPEPEERVRKDSRKALYAARGKAAFVEWMSAASL